SIIDHFAIKTEVSTEEGKLVLQGSGKAFEEFLSKEKVTFAKKERKLYQKTLGFRSNKLWKKVAAMLVYLSVFFLILMFTFGDRVSDSESIDTTDEVSATSTTDKQEDKTVVEEQQKQEEEARVDEEKEEAEAVRLAEEQKKQEEAEAARLAEEKKKEEEAARIAEEQKKQEEAARVAEEQRQQEEAARVAEEQRQQEEAAAAAAAESQASNVYYKNCSAVRAAGAAPIRVGEPGYSRKLDRDGDGIGCEV